MVDETPESSESPSDPSREPPFGASAGPNVPVDEDERAAFHSGTVSSGHETSEDDVDEILYGDSPV